MGKEQFTYCCRRMTEMINLGLDRNGEIVFDNVNVIMRRMPDGTFGIPVYDGGTSIVVITFCPWCGNSLIPEGEY